MSDDSKDESLDPADDKMTDRLASLRASIRASKSRTGTPPIGSLRPATIPTEEAPEPEPEPAVEADAEAEAQQSDAPDAANDEFVADDTMISQSSEFAIPTEEPAEPDEASPPPRSARKTGEKFITDDLHRVVATGEHAAVTADSGLMSQLDQASESAEVQEAGHSEASDAFTVGPTTVHKLDDLALVQGTPLYMSPEQCRNDPAEPPTDVYSLGVMMFELLEGHPPFLGDSIEEVVYKHLDAPVPEQTSQFTPDEVKNLVGRMLSKDAADRPDMVEIIQVLQRHTSIGGADVEGLEEESWSVSEIDESAPAQDQAPVTISTLPGLPPLEDEPLAAPARKVPVWLFGLLGVVALLIVALAIAGGSDEPTEPTQTTGLADPVVAQQTVAEEPVEEPVAVEEPSEPPTEETAGMEFGAQPDAGVAAAETPDAGAQAEVAEPPEEPVQVAEEKPESKPKPKRRPRKKKTPKLQEIRL